MTNTPSIVQCSSTEASLLSAESGKINLRNGDGNQNKRNHNRISTSPTACSPPSVRILDPADFLENGEAENGSAIVKDTDDSTTFNIQSIAIAIPVGVDDPHVAVENSATLARKPLAPEPFPQTMVALLCSGTVLLGLAVVGTLVEKILDSYNGMYAADEMWG